MRTMFYAKDPETEKGAEAVAEMLRDWGLKGTISDAVRYSIKYTAVAHGLIPAQVGREVPLVPDARSNGEIDIDT